MLRAADLPSPRATPDAVLARARQLAPAHLELLAQLVKLDSSAGGSGAVACAQACGAALSGLGFTVDVVRAGSDRAACAHVVAERPPVARDAARPRTLLLVGHLDTVLPGGPDRLYRERERWRGPGVIDMKGGVVTALLTLALGREADWLDQIHVKVVLNGDEETGSATGGVLVQAAATGADAALCFEAAREGGGVVIARKGLGVARITVQGLTGHAGIDHDRAANAFSALCRLVARAEDLERTLAITVSAGGQVASSPGALNAIPDRASCELEWRFFDLEAGQRVLPALRAAADEIAAATGASVVIEGGIEVPPMQPTATAQALLARYQAAARTLGLTVVGASTAGVGDMNAIAALGPACLDGVGPEGGAMHSTDEWLAVESIAERAAMNAIAIAGWCDDARAREGA